VASTGLWSRNLPFKETTVHYHVSKSPPLGPLLCSAKRIRSTLPHPVSSRCFKHPSIYFYNTVAQISAPRCPCN